MLCIIIIIYLVIDERDLLLGVPVSSMTSVWPLTPVYLVIMHRTKGPAAGSASQYYYLSLTLEPWPLFILSLCIDQRDLHAGSASHSDCSMTPVWPLTPVYLVIMYRWEGPAARSASQDADGPCHQCSHGHTQSCLSLPGECAATCSTVILEAKTYYALTLKYKIHWASKETYHFFRVTHIKIQSIKMNYNWG